MRGDEFNQIHPKNEAYRKGSEFSSTQRGEYTAQSENPSFGRAEENEARVHNEDVSYTSPKAEKKKDTVADNLRQVKAGTTSASASSAAHSVIVAAAAVTATAVSTVIGITVVNESKASVEFQRFFLGHETLDYSLILRDVKEGEDPYYIRVENGDYSSSQELHAGENEGYFEGLSPKQVYTVTVAQPKFAGKTIYQEQFTMSPSSVAYGVYFSGEVDFEEHSFQVSLSYEDPEDHLTDFRFVLQGQEEEKVFPLAKQWDYQTVSFEPGTLLSGQTYNYSLRYKDHGNEKNLPGEQVTLRAKEVPPEPEQGEVYGIEWDYAVSFTSPIATLWLVYEDPQERFSSFALTFSGIDAPSVSIPLEKTLDEQQIDLSPLELSPERCDFNITLRYLDQDELMDMDFGWALLEDSDDPIPEGEVYGLNWDYTASFSAATATVSLNYDDPQDRFSDFQLQFTALGEEAIVIALSKSLEEQAVNLEPLSLSEQHCSFALSLLYLDMGKSESLDLGEITITDTDAPEPEGQVYGLEWDYSLSFSDPFATVKLSYDDPQDRFADFVLVFSDEYASSFEVSLAKTQEAQQIDLYGLALSADHHEFTLLLEYADSGVPATIYYGLVTLVDTDPPIPQGEVYGISWDKKVSYAYPYAEMTLSYDDPAEAFSDFKLSFDDGQGLAVEIPLTKTLDAQTVDLSGLDLSEDHCEFTGALLYLDGQTHRSFDLGLLVIEDVPEPMVYGIEFLATELTPERQLTFTLDYYDTDEGVLSNTMTFTLTDVAGNSESHVIEKTSEPQTITLGEGLPIDPEGTTFIYALTYQSAHYEDEQILDGEVTLTYNPPAPEAAITSFTLSHTMDFQTGEVKATVVYDDPKGILEEIRLVLIDAETEVEQSRVMELSSGEEQSLYYGDAFDNSFNPMSHAMNYRLETVIAGVSSVAEASEQPFYFSSLPVSEFYDVESSFYVSDDGFMPIRLSLLDEQGIYSDPIVTLKGEDGEVRKEVALCLDGIGLTEWQYLDLGEDWRSVFADETSSWQGSATVLLSVSMMVRDDVGASRMIVYEEQPKTIYDGSYVSQIEGIRMDSFTIDAAEPILSYLPIYVDPFGMTDFTLQLEFNNGETYRFATDIQTLTDRDERIIIDPRLTLEEDELKHFLALLAQEEVSIGLSYMDPAGEEHTVTTYYGIRFDVQNQ